VDARRRRATQLGLAPNTSDARDESRRKQTDECACELAPARDGSLDIFLVRKLGLPGHPELAMGAIATGGVQLMDEAVITASGISPETGELEVVDENGR